MISGRYLSTLTAMALPIAFPAAAALSDAAKLADYVGKYPFQKVHGQRFMDNRAVIEAVRKAVAEPSIAQEVLRRGVSTPIVLAGSAVLLSTCRPHMCGLVNWAIAVRPVNGKAAVCYHHYNLTGNESRWFVEGRLVANTIGDCGSPSLPRAVAAAIG